MKPYVICHMYISIDGKIDGAYMDESGCDISGAFYDDVIFEMGSSMAGGRVTSQLYKAKGKNVLDNFENEVVPEGDFIIPAKHYQFCFDRMGKCFYDDPWYCYGGEKMQIVEVVSSACDKRYLAYLRKMQIAYMIADSVREALEKMYNEWKVERLVLTGGAIINGGFFKENCIDEISLVVAPYVEGNNIYKQFVGDMNAFMNQKYRFYQANPLADGGVQLIFKK